MLTAHQRMSIRTKLPEVREINARHDRGEIELYWIRLELADESTIVVFGVQEDGCRCRRSRVLPDDYSDRPVIEPIPAEMQERLVAVFGPLRFDPV